MNFLGVNEASCWAWKNWFCLIYSWEFSGIPKIALESLCGIKGEIFFFKKIFTFWYWKES